MHVAISQILHPPPLSSKAITHSSLLTSRSVDWMPIFHQKLRVGQRHALTSCSTHPNFLESSCSNKSPSCSSEIREAGLGAPLLISGLGWCALTREVSPRTHSLTHSLTHTHTHFSHERYVRNQGHMNATHTQGTLTSTTPHT